MTQHKPTPDTPLLAEFPHQDLAAWRSEVERLLKGAPFAQRMFTATAEGIDVGPLYTAADTADLPWDEHYPGQLPYVRGTRAGGYQAGGWLVAQEIPYPTVEEFNLALRHDLQQGQNAVCLKLDTAGLRGLDPDQAEVGAVGQHGTSLASLSELELALDGVDLEEIPLCLQGGSAALPLAAVLVALLNKQGKDVRKLRGSLGSDPVHGLAQDGNLPVDLGQVFDELALLTGWAAVHAPQVSTLPISEIPWHQGGADSSLSLGLTLATAVNALRAMEKRGLSVETAADHIVFRMVVGPDFFMEIAKLRALRLLWSDILAAAGCPAEAGKVRVHAQTSPRCLTVLDPHVNMLRATTMAMSAVLGGADSLHVSCFDEMDSLPDEFSRRIARNVSLILAQESHLDQVNDPAGGSWYVEKLTADLAEKAWGVFQDIEAAGGIAAAMQSGQVQETVAAAADARRDRLATGRDVLVGTNKYVNSREPARKSGVPDREELHRLRSADMARLRTSAAHEDHRVILKRLEKIMTAEPDEIFATLVDAAALGATLGEMTSILRHNAGKQPPVALIALRRDSEPFENLRHAVQGARVMDPRQGRVFCACLGDVARYMPRLEFVREFFRVGGFEVSEGSFFETPAEALAGVRDSGAATVVLVGLDETYAVMAAALARLLTAENPQPRIVLAGKPGRLEGELTEAGVAEFIHTRSNLLEVLGGLIFNSEVGA